MCRDWIDFLVFWKFLYINWYFEIFIVFFIWFNIFVKMYKGNWNEFMVIILLGICRYKIRIGL